MLTASLVIGVVISLLVTEIVGLTAGGIVVPGYVALLLDRPVPLLGFLAASLLAFGFVRLLSTRLMLFGSRRFAVAVLSGMTISIGAQWATPALAPANLEWASLGFVVPGLLANQFDRQGVWPTLLALAIAAPITRLLVILAVRW